MNREFLNKLSLQRDRSHNSFFVNLYFPGLSVCYEDHEDAVDTLSQDEHNIAPRVIFQIIDSKDHFLPVHTVTQNEKDTGMLLGSRIHLKIESMREIEYGFVFFEACYVQVPEKSV